MKNETIIATTKKGKRIFLEGLNTVGWDVGDRYSVGFSDNGAILIIRDVNGKRKVSSPAKGGVIDLESKKVAKWAGNSERAKVSFGPIDSILIERV